MESEGCSERKIDWSKCFVCQGEKDEDLRSGDRGRNTLSINLPRFAAVNGLKFDSFWLESIDNLKETLHKNKASYHHSCASEYNERNLKRAENRYHKPNAEKGHDLSSYLCKRRSGGTSKEVGNLICCFCKQGDVESNLCAAGAYHAKKKQKKCFTCKDLDSDMDRNGKSGGR